MIAGYKHKCNKSNVQCQYNHRIKIMTQTEHRSVFKKNIFLCHEISFLWQTGTCVEQKVCKINVLLR